MNSRTPSLRQHASGHYFCRWGGKDHYFGKEKTEARKRYLKSIEEWAAWRSARDARRLPPMTKSYLVAEVAERFLAIKEAEGGKDVRSYYLKHLNRFLRAYGDVRADTIRASHLMDLRTDMLEAKFAPKTVNHDMTAIKGMLNWAAGMEVIPPVNLSVVRSLPLGPTVDKSLPVAQVRKWIKGAPEPVKPWMAINYLCLMRPIEVVRCVQQQGEWVEKGVFRLHRGKIDRSARLARHVVFSAAALRWLKRCEPVWSRLDSYSSAVRRACPGRAPHPLRHSAATHLHQLGVARADIDLLLGHAPPRVSLIYARIEWQPLRRLAGRLKLGFSS